MNELIEVRVSRKWTEADGICALDLVRADGGALPPFEAGAHIDVHLADGLVRQYSLCNGPHETGIYRIAVLREPSSRGGSAAVHDALMVGSTLKISAPRNFFGLAKEAPHHLLLAGGIGVTPILAMAQALHARGGSFTMHYATRNRARTAFADALAAAPYAANVHLHHDDGPAEQRLDLTEVLRAAPAGNHLYVCGPAGFMNAAIDAARHQGWADERIHRESFQAAAPSEHDAAGFELVLSRSGRVIPVLPDQTALRALLDAGIDVPYSCEQGVCGTCLTRVVEGGIEHRDQYLTDEERAAQDQFLPCCSRAQGKRLVLEL